MNGNYCARFSDVGRFPFNQNVRFKFSATSRCEWQSILQNFHKRGQPREVYPNFQKFFPGVCFPFNFASGFLEFSVEWFAFRKFNSFRNFWKLFGDISVPFAPVSKFSKVLDEWKAPIISRGNHWWRREKSAVSQGSHPQLFIHNDIEQRYGVYFAMKS